MMKLSSVALGALLSLAFGSVAFAQGAIFNPALLPPMTAPAPGNVDVLVSGVVFSELREISVGNGRSMGVAATIRYAGGPAWQVGVTGYYELASPDSVLVKRGGIGIEGSWIVSGAGTRTRVTVNLRGQIVGGRKLVEGGGIGASLLIEPPASGAIRTFFALGPIVGIGRLDGPPPSYQFFLGEQPVRPQWGYGIVGNAGAMVAASMGVDFFGELSAGIQFNEWDRETTSFFAPSAGLRVRF